MRSIVLKSFVITAALVMLSGSTAAETSFLVSDYDTNNPYFTADLSVDPVEAEFGRVSIYLVPEEKEGFDITGFSITETIVEPGAWDEMLPVVYEFSALPAEGKLTLHAWVQYSDNSYVLAGSDWIVYETSEPALSNLSITPHTYSIDLFWNSDPDLAIGWAEYRKVGDVDWLMSQPSQFEYGLDHAITITGLTEETEYELVLHCNGTVVDTIDDEPIIVTTDPAFGTQEPVVWSGALVPDLSWSRGPNWQDMSPPANPTTGSVSLLIDGSAPYGTWATGADYFDVDTVTAVLDPDDLPNAQGDEVEWEIGSLNVTATDTTAGGAGRSHRLRMGEQGDKTLIVNGELKVANNTRFELDGGRPRSPQFQEHQSRG